MCGAVHRSCVREGIHEKHEDERRRGMTEQQRLIWVLSMPVCAEMNNTMLDLTGVSYSTSEQNVDISEPRKKFKP